MAAAWILDGNQALGYALYQVCTLTLVFTAAVFSEYSFQNTLELRFINQFEKPRKTVHLCLDICVWLRAKVVGHPPDMRLKVQSSVEGLWDLQDMDSLEKHGLILCQCK